MFHNLLELNGVVFIGTLLKDVPYQKGLVLLPFALVTLFLFFLFFLLRQLLFESAFSNSIAHQKQREKGQL